MPLQIEVLPITPDDSTLYLVGPEGLVWVQPAVGDAVILAARDELEKALVAAHIGELLNMGLAPYGIPLNQRYTVAMFGGSPIRDCHWVLWNEAPAPAGDEGDTLPSQTAVIITADNAARRRGGQSTTPAKAAAARSNGRKGGRPRKQTSE